MRPGVRPALLLACVALVMGSVGSAAAYPSGFSEEVVAAGLTDPTAIAFFPDGRIAIAQKSGIVRLVKNGVLQPTPLIDIQDRVNDFWDHGLLGIAVDPNPANPYIYLLYTYENAPSDYEGTKTARLARYTVSGDTASPASEVVILGTSVGATCKGFQPGADCIPSDGPSHSIGNVKFAPDGNLFVTAGDASSFYTVDPDALRVQDLDSLAGKVLRITPTGQGLPDNPFWTGSASANRSKVWAYGVRNAYRFGVRPGTGTGIPYVGDVGWDTYEELNVAKAGANFGWPCYEGVDQQPGYASLSACQALYGGSSGSLASLGTPIAKVMTPLGSGGPLSVIKDGIKPAAGSGDSSRQYDSWDGDNAASQDWVGYTFTAPHTFDRVVFQEGMHFFDGGWFNPGTLTVQVRQNGTWVNVSGLAISPAYPGNNGVSFETFTFTFTAIQGDGIRIFGAPGGSAAFISVGEVEVYGDGSGGGGGGGGGQPGETMITAQATAAIAKVPNPLGSGGPLTVIRDGIKPPVGTNNSSQQYDSWDGDNAATEDWIGYTFSSAKTFTRVVFQEGIHFFDGGWFKTLTVQVRQSGTWVTVSGLTSTPAYPGNNGVSFETFSLAFTPIQGDAIRIYGAPGGSAAFVSVGELDVFAASDPGDPPPPPPPSGTVTAPLVYYSHNGSTAAMTSGTFYTGTSYPGPYQGAFFYGDFSENLLRTLRVDANDAVVPGSLADFHLDADGPVDIEMGPDGMIYYVAISANEVRRIRYTLGNTPPTANASATPTSGVAPLSVQFSSTGSQDPDGDPITFDWNFGDGTTGTGAAPAHTYSANGNYTAILTVRDNRGGVATDTVPIQVGNLPPVATISAPAATFTYQVGTVVNYSGSATDPEQGTLPPSALSWQIVIHHCPGGTCHTHPFTSFTGTSGSFTVPDHGDESYFEIILTATDAGGLTGTASVNIQPKTVQLTVASAPTGLLVTYDGTEAAAPLVRTTIVGSVHTLSINPAHLTQGQYTFQSWSDGGATQHQITVGTTNVTYTANFSTSSSGCPVGQYKAEYFSNGTLTGTPVLTRCEGAINYSWGNGGPGSGVPNDNFSVRWTGRFTFLAGSQTFTTVSDDGVRLWVDNVLVVDFWTDHGPTTRTGTRTMTAGDHDVKVEYYERTGGAVIQVGWTGAGGGSGEANIAGQAATLIAKVPNPLGSGGPLTLIRDGIKPPVGTNNSSQQYDSWDGDNAATEDWIGYTFSSAKTFTKVVFQEGMHFGDGGWFTAAPTVQVRQNGTWVTVSNRVVTPAYPGNNGTSFESFTITFTQIQGDAIRLYGTPAGSAQFISVGELEVYALVP